MYYCLILLLQLTNTHLFLWEPNSDMIKRLKELQAKNYDLSKYVAGFIQTLCDQAYSNSTTALKFELPIGAVYHVRSVNSCDLFHERAEDLPRVFQIIYDRQYLATIPLTNLNSNNLMKSSNSLGLTGIYSVQS